MSGWALPYHHTSTAPVVCEGAAQLLCLSLQEHFAAFCIQSGASHALGTLRTRRRCPGIPNFGRSTLAGCFYRGPHVAFLSDAHGGWTGGKMKTRISPWIFGLLYIGVVAALILAVNF
jgi:hypothetical protein